MTSGLATEEREDQHASDLTQTLTDGPNGATDSVLPNGHAHNDLDANQAAFERNGQSSESRGQKRKLLDLESGKPPSPPWRSFKAEGPTSFVEGGRRKSGRTNALPLEKLPQGYKRQTRRAQQDYVSKKHGAPDDAPGQQASDRAAHNLNHSRHSDQGTPKHGDRALPFERTPTAGQLHRTYTTSDKHGRTSLPDQSNTKSQPTEILPKPMPPRSHKRSRQRESPLRTPEIKRSTRKTSEVQRQPGHSFSPPEAPSKGLRLRLRLSKPPVPVRSPLHIPRPAMHGSLRNYLAQDKPHEGEESAPPLTREAVSREARARNRVVEASRPGGVLTDERFIGPDQEPAATPISEYAHPDYLVKHVIDLQQRMQREQREHRALAKRFALLAQAKWRERQPKSSEEILREQQALIRVRYKDMLKDLSQQMKKVEDMYMHDRLQEYEANQGLKEKQHLQKLLDNSQQLLIGRSKRKLSSTASEHGVSGEDVDSSDGSRDDASSSAAVEEDNNDNDDEEDEDDSSFDESSDENLADVGDDALTVEQLRQKYASLPESGDRSDEVSEDDTPSEDRLLLEDDHIESELSRQQSSEPSDRDAETEELPIEAVGLAKHELEEVDDVMMDDSDVSGSTSGTEYSSSEDDEEAASDEQSSDEESNGLMGFLSRGQRKVYTGVDSEDAKGEENQKHEVKMDNDVIAKPEDVDQPGLPTGKPLTLSKTEANPGPSTPGITSTSGDPSHRDSPSTNATPKEDALDSMSSVQSSDYQEPVTEEEKAQTPIPSLLRGTLRIYQHKGLDWLSGMYAKSTNGILADEMGLGKTIQTIALLAHLATHHEVWGPHLVVVPTSVMLNWEMEFKKFCPGFKILTYYGTQEERKAKRRGWTDDDRWHVCITSYQLAIADAIALKRRNWHYLILDEAHNIKNFRSQRWQTLLGFKSQARLLLTGTPLQNNLGELWSLLFFLAPEENLEGETSFGDLTKFSKTFRRPVEQILDSGQETLDDEARDVVMKLHNVLRPHLLRRLKSEVEKQMPKKYEHVTVCRLSKRQKYLYDGYMGLAGTRASFASGNYMSIINCLMQLRKVCNHPDLFETRQIVTSFAMPKSAIADFEIKELLVRRRLLDDDSNDVGLFNLWSSNSSTADCLRVQKLSAVDKLRSAVDILKAAIVNVPAPNGQSISSSLSRLEKNLKLTKLKKSMTQLEMTQLRTRQRPIYGNDLLPRLDCGLRTRPLPPAARRLQDMTGAYLSRSSILEDMIQKLPQRSAAMQTTIQKFGCITPAVTAPGIARLALTQPVMSLLQQRESRFLRQPQQQLSDPFHEARIRLSIAFPDKSLIQYDCGKLQKLAVLLRTLQSNGHRALIFTQMTKVLDILEQFLNLHGHRYLRLDGATKIEQRQVLTERFNSDPRILAFILSSRSGGLGINLTGADTVIFYDLDWNPAMDKQCQDRCHRIGQTRDVHIYRFVSEGTIEMNILRKSNQKRILDDVVIQQGDFTTEYFNQVVGPHRSEEDAEADAALDRILGGGQRRAEKDLGEVEDKEDQDAAKLATKEDGQVDDADFGGDKSTSGPGTPKVESNPINRIQRQSTGGASSSPLAQTPMTPIVPVHRPSSNADARFEPLFVPTESGEIGYGLPQDKAPFDPEKDVSHAIYNFYAWAYKDVVIMPPSERSRKRAKKGKMGGVPVIRR
ncbi:MAG: swr1 complex component [Chrysothrix sp. TS-e1954]|nr:MAG: swr1 complex component [Chrysothrix sp. TS-e1954]